MPDNCSKMINMGRQLTAHVSDEQGDEYDERSQFKLYNFSEAVRHPPIWKRIMKYKCKAEIAKEKKPK